MADRNDRGDIIASWLLPRLAILAVIAVSAYEVLAIGVTAVSADDSAREVARAARDAYRTGGQPAAQAAAEEVGLTRGVDLVAVEIDGDDVVAVVDEQARTLLVHQVGFLDGLEHTARDRPVAPTTVKGRGVGRTSRRRSGGA